MSRLITRGLLAAATLGLMPGCAALQPSGPSGGEDLRRLVIETRREVDELRKDQERLRGVVEYLQYSANNPAHAAPVSPNIVHSETGSAAPSMFPAAELGAGGTAGALAPPAVPAPEAGAGVVPGTVPGMAPTVIDPMIASVTGAGVGASPEPIAVDSQVPTVPPELRGSGYDDGVRSFVEQQYEDSIQYFRNFIHADSTSAYADDAQYWIGESYLRRSMYSNAIKEFNQVVLRYGSGDKAAPALLKLAQVFSKIGDQVDARLSLQKLVNRYPGTSEATQAYGMLQQMGG
jgi:tol-pal system protein YbgF